MIGDEEEYETIITPTLEQQVAAVITTCDYQVTNTPIAEILCDDKFNCRGKVLPTDVYDLIEQIKLQGLQTPITVRPCSDVPGKKYKIVAGHRRFTAFKVMGKTEIPCFVREGLDELGAHIINLTENLSRVDLNMLQEANALRPYLEAGWTEATISEQVKMSRGWVQVRLMLLKLPEPIQQEASAGMLSQEQIRKVYAMGSEQEMYEAVRLIKERRAAGEKTNIVVKKPMRPHRKEARTPEEIFALQEIIQKNMGDSLVTRMMGWTAGVVTDYQIHRDIREVCKTLGRHYEIPKELTDKL